MTTKAPIAPRIDEAAPQRMQQRSARSRPLIRPLGYSWYPRAKAAADFVLATLIAVPALPVILLAALAVRLTSRGPAFYSQTRVGKDGTPFTIWKIRTMTHQCEALTGARWCVPGDSRVTAIGWFLRKTHIDELPQLWNVLRGDMSLVGPRPERPEFIPELEAALPAYRQRLQVRPGVTGLAQLQLPPDTDIDSVRRKLSHDLYYVRHLGPWMDARLLFCTAFYAAGVPFRWLSLMLGVPASPAIAEAMRDVVQIEPLANRRAA